MPRNSSMTYQHYLSTLYKGASKLFERLRQPWYNPINRIFLYLSGAEVGANMCTSGRLRIKVTRRGEVRIGQNFHANSGVNHNVIGRQQRCMLWVEGRLIIGDNVGMSNSALICNHAITIGNHVTIGGNTVIYDTDFHSLDPALRSDPGQDREGAKWAPVLIEDHAFIGAHSTILKGVTIGEGAVIGACSLVSRNIPAGEIWAGNPARKVGFVNQAKPSSSCV